MQKKRRNGRASTKTSVEDEIAHLRGLDLGGLRARWQNVFQRQAPSHLTRHLLFAVIAYRLNPLTLAIVRRMVQTDHVNLVNLLLGREAVPVRTTVAVISARPGARSAAAALPERKKSSP